MPEEFDEFLEDGYEEEFELEFPTEFFYSATSLEEFIYHHASHMLGEKAVLLTSCVVFEYLDEKGQLKASVLHKSDIPKSSMATMLYAAFKEIGKVDEQELDDDEPYNPKDF
jgi:hypothetical protein